MHKLAITLALLAVTSPASAVGRVTVDPNASGAVQAEAALPASDPRLARKVTLCEYRRPVRWLLDYLAKSSGVALQAGYNANDWQVRDRKLSVVCKDTPLAELLSSIAGVTNFKWKLNGKGTQTSYRLYMDRTTLLGAEAQMLRRQALLREENTRKRKEMLDTLVNIDNLPQDELLRMKQTEPYLYVLTTTGVAGSMGRMFRSMPALSDAIAGGHYVALDGAKLPGATQKAVADFLTNIDRFSRELGEGGPDLGAAASQPEQLELSINKTLNNSDVPGVPPVPLLADIHVKIGGLSPNSMLVSIPIVEPDSELGRVMGQALIDAREGRISSRDIGRQINDGVKKARATDLQQKGEPLTEHADDPALAKKIKMEPYDTQLASVQTALADASGFAVVTDCCDLKFDLSPWFTPSPDEEAIRAIVDKLGTATHSNWDRRKGVIEFRDRDWFQKRSAQIPDAMLEKWQRAYQKTGTLEIDHLAEMSQLTQEQIDANIVRDDVLSQGGVDSALMHYDDILDFYARLTPSQKAAIFGSSGLGLADLSKSQRQNAEDLIKQSSPTFFANPGARVTLTGTRTALGKAYQYQISARSTDVQDPVNWEVKTPLYPEPKTK